jgi:hypothetical protein
MFTNEICRGAGRDKSCPYSQALPRCTGTIYRAPLPIADEYVQHISRRYQSGGYSPDGLSVRGKFCLVIVGGRLNVKR